MTHTFLILTISALVLAALGGLYVYAWSVPTWQIFGPALLRGPATDRRIALTFDDGPVPPFTEQVLDILRVRKVPATFFVCGKNVERFPQILRRIQAEGARWIGVYPVLRERGLRLVNWSDTGYDWLEKSDIVRETLKNLGPGSIILLHDGRRADPPETIDRSRTVSALPAIIDAARDAGFTFVPLAEFLSS